MLKAAVLISAINTAVYYVSNEVGHMVLTSIPRPEIRRVIAYASSNALVNSGFLQILNPYISGLSDSERVAILGFLSGIIADLVMSRIDVKTSVVDNAIANGVAYIGNYGIKMILDKTGVLQMI